MLKALAFICAFLAIIFIIIDINNIYNHHNYNLLTATDILNYFSISYNNLPHNFMAIPLSILFTILAIIFYLLVYMFNKKRSKIIPH